MILYKYRSSDRGIKVLKDQALYFSRPSEFEDPLDTKIELIYPDGPYEWDQFIKRISPMSSRERLDLLEAFLPTINYSGVIYSRLPNNDVLQQHEQSINALSLTDNWDNFRMWNTYGENQSGVAIGFYTEEIGSIPHMHFDTADLSPYSDFYTNGFLPLSRIVYEDPFRKKIYNLVTGNYRDISRSLVFKDKISYKHEREWRIIAFSINFNNGHLPSHPVIFHKESLSEIVIGSEANSDCERDIKDIVTSKYPGVPIYKCSFNHITRITTRKLIQ